ncbi:MAG: type III pantothenate kinase [Kiritimatiellaeota bacterium]|nr:type III pantothenate kinase [Kiritimatiellota bacterium]
MTHTENILLIDAGNTSTTLGLSSRGRVREIGRVPTAERRPAALRRAARRLLGARRVDAAVLCAVVPAVVPLWKNVLRELGAARPLVVSHRLKLGVAISYPRPETIGADRLANAAGAVARYGAPVIVVDFGTATTFDIISRARGYVGGIIAPGLDLMFDYLAERTALLPRIRPAAVRGRVGRSTRAAMQLGAQWGYRGMVREILAQVLRAAGERDATLVTTGGQAAWVVRGARLGLRLNRDLTLSGLARIYELNKGKVEG